MSLSLERLRSDGDYTGVGLSLARLDFTREDYEAFGYVLGALSESLKWAIGDYLLEGERRYGEEAYQLQESLGISEESRRQYIRTAEAIPMSRRRPELSWSHHRTVAALEPAEQDAWLEKAVQNDWNSAALAAHRKPENGKTQVVVDEVIRSANHVVDKAWPDEIHGYLVPNAPMDELREALGRGEG